MALPDVGTVVALANAPAGLDVALRQSPTSYGRLTWDWSGPDGDLLFDDTAAYPVFGTVLGHKGLYRWDRTLGTLIFTLLKDRRSTGSRFTAYGRDGGAQVEADQIAEDVTLRADRLGVGRWRGTLKWVAAGHRQQRGVRF